jgi:hypothetical protein
MSPVSSAITPNLMVSAQTAALNPSKKKETNRDNVLLINPPLLNVDTEKPLNPTFMINCKA